MISALASSIITKTGYGPMSGSFTARGKEHCGAVTSSDSLFRANIVSVFTMTFSSRNGEVWGQGARVFCLLLFLVC